MTMATDQDTMTRWTVTVSRQTDISLRSFLAQRGLKKGDISKFIEDAVRWRVLDQTITEARDSFGDLSPKALQAMIDEATGQVLKEISGPKPRRPRKSQ
jgi:hypothetical protein